MKTMTSLIICMLGIATASALQFDNFEYEINNWDTNTLTITEYTGTDLNILIPSIISNKTVTTIGDSSFSYKSITNIAIPESVSSIGSWAFESCSELINVGISNSSTVINRGAFQRCYDLKEFAIPDNTTYISDRAFYQCGLTNLSLPAGITEIGESAFYHCIDLSSVILPNVTFIGDTAFADCWSLTNIYIPASVITLGERAFDSCKNLEEISVNTSNKFYCSLDGVLFNKNKTELIQYPSNKLGSEYAIPHGVNIIKSHSISESANLISVIIPEGVTEVEGSAISSNYELTKVLLPKSLTSIGNHAFSHNQRLSEISIPKGVMSIGWYAFSFCTDLDSIYFHGDHPSIGNPAFNKYTLLYYLPEANGWDIDYIHQNPVLWNPSFEKITFEPVHCVIDISGPSNALVKIETATNLVSDSWNSVGLQELSGGSTVFIDNEWTNHQTRYYRIKMP